MSKIKLYEEYFNESITKFDDFGKDKDPKEGHEAELGVDNDKDELEPEEDDDDENHLEEGADPLVVTSKDTMRIQDIQRKSNGNMDKAKKLAQTMCKLITDKWKAIRRARAAERENEHDLADIFFNRAKELGAFSS